eukprot:TRINITY_DN8278_c0_g1_i2.p1 TRINITY_DN8278_c0_g1~~TRINITY_DN8278_c0_g1_i2.p1  ORF type:complete len:290 (-),score=62.99 TRINITY_DN8278_c0_g1_i2:34-903(-)
MLMLGSRVSRGWQVLPRTCTRAFSTSPGNVGNPPSITHGRYRYRYVFAILPAIAFGLGTWQLQRAKWKQNIIQEAKQQVEKDIIQLNSADDVALLSGSSNENDQYKFRRVRLSGRYLGGRPMPVGPRVLNGKGGFYVFSPFVPELTPPPPGGAPVLLINRGWIDKDHVGYLDSPQYAAQQKDRTEIVGLVRTPQERPNTFTPDNQPEKNVWYWIDGPAMAKHTGGRAVPVLLNAITDSSLPPKSKIVPLEVDIEKQFFNNHMTYVATWYSLSALLTGFTWYLVRSPPRL